MRLRQRAAFALATASAMLTTAGSTAAADPRGEANVEIVEYEGWERNIKLSNGTAELIVTLEVGPRIISYRLLDGDNVFRNYDEQLGKAGESSWMIRGGHRLWSSPEDPDRTYIPDNGPVRHEQLGPGQIRVALPPDPTFGLQKEMEITLEPEGTGVSIRHRIRNAGRERAEVAIWALSVMKPGGVEVIPLPPKAPHPGGAANATAEQFAPQLSLALWSYTDFQDPRWHFGTDAIALSQDAETDRGPTKLGLSCTPGAVGYLNGGTLFIKRFPHRKEKRYPDFGSNYETFTNAEMLEMESLGPLVHLGPGETVEHVERWELIGEVEAVDGVEGAIEAALPHLKGD